MARGASLFLLGLVAVVIQVEGIRCLSSCDAVSISISGSPETAAISDAVASAYWNVTSCTNVVVVAEAEAPAIADAVERAIGGVWTRVGGAGCTEGSQEHAASAASAVATSIAEAFAGAVANGSNHDAEAMYNANATAVERVIKESSAAAAASTLQEEETIDVAVAKAVADALADMLAFAVAAVIC